MHSREKFTECPSSFQRWFCKKKWPEAAFVQLALKVIIFKAATSVSRRILIHFTSLLIKQWTLQNYTSNKKKCSSSNNIKKTVRRRRNKNVKSTVNSLISNWTVFNTISVFNAVTNRKKRINPAQFCMILVKVKGTAQEIRVTKHLWSI